MPWKRISLFAVDTNILLYAVRREAPEHKKALSLIQRWMKDGEIWFATWNVIYEFLRVSTHAAVFQKPLSLRQALQFVDQLLNNSEFSVLNEGANHYEVLKDLSFRYPRVSANLVHDFHTAVILQEKGIRLLYTADKDFLQFDFLKAIDPVH